MLIGGSTLNLHKSVGIGSSINQNYWWYDLKWFNARKKEKTFQEIFVIVFWTKIWFVSYMLSLHDISCQSKIIICMYVLSMTYSLKRNYKLKGIITWSVVGYPYKNYPSLKKHAIICDDIFYRWISW